MSRAGLHAAYSTTALGRTPASWRLPTHLRVLGAAWRAAAAGRRPSLPGGARTPNVTRLRRDAWPAAMCTCTAHRQLLRSTASSASCRPVCTDTCCHLQ